MPNMDPKKTPMPEQAPNVRNRNFDEVALGYTEEMALLEAGRCLRCKNMPCISGCPVGVKIPQFIEKVAQRDYEQAYQIISATNALPAVCGRVCPQENQCESKCVRGIKGESVGIGRLERFVADWHAQNGRPAARPAKRAAGKAAVIGAGPAGLTCAGTLAREGFDVTVFEAIHRPGGVLVYGIPEFRLPKAIVQREIENLEKIGVKIATDVVVGRTITVDELEGQGFGAIFIGSGAGLPSFMGIEGENLIGVYSANEFLTRVNLMKAYRDDYDTPFHPAKSVAVVGGGNVAMDAARCAIRLGAQRVSIVYRRSEEEIPARREEIHHAKEEGIAFEMLTAPTRILGDGNGRVRAMECVKMKLLEPDASGRRRPEPIEGSAFTLDVDSVIMAIGTAPNPLLHTTTPGLEINRRGCLVVNEEMATTRAGVYAGGDAVTGAATVILAMGAGKTAAHAMAKHLHAMAKPLHAMGEPQPEETQDSTNS